MSVRSRKDKRVIYVSGAWDPFHIGHLNVLETAANLGDILVVGVSRLCFIRECKQREPFLPCCDRIRLISALRIADHVMPYNGPDDMVPIDLFRVDVVVFDQRFCKGDSPLAIRQRRARKLLRKRGVRIVIVPRTPGISSTQVRGAFDV